MHPVGCTIRIYYDARAYERQTCQEKVVRFVKAHG